MAEQSFPFEDIDTTEAQFSKWARNFQDTGVQGAPTGTELKVTASGTTMIVDVAIGQVFIQGHYYINTASKPLTVTSAGTNTRIDYIVAELDTTANTIVTKIVEGTAVSSSPVAPTLTQTDSLYQFPLALLTIPTSSAVINNAMLTDKRVFMSQRVGIWTTATRPASPLTNQTLGYNTTLSYHEFWNGSAWVQLAPPVDLTTVIPKNVLTTTGDLIVANGSGSVTRLGIGSTNQILTSNGTTATWATPAGGGGMTQIASGTLSGTSVNIASIPGTYKSLELRVYNFTLSAQGTVFLNTYAGANVIDLSGKGWKGGGLVSEAVDFSQLTASNANNTINFKLENYSLSSSYAKTFAVNARAVSATTGSTNYALFGTPATGTNGAITEIRILTATSFTAGNYVLYGVN